MEVALSAPDITETEIEAVVEVLRGTQLSLGPRLEEFERLVAGYAGMPYGVAVSSGTAGLHLCLVAMGVGAGDEVLVPSFTFIAAANVIRYVGAVPVFVDIEEGSLNMDPEAVEAAVTERTRAILAVHTFGRPAAMGRILAVAQRHGLRVVEDACEAIGAEYQGRRVGGLGDAGVFAFYPNKQITTGEGGVIVLRDASLDRELRALRNQGRYASDAWHQHSLLGFNYRMSEMQAALGVAQMGRLSGILERRAEVARWYEEELGGTDGVLLPAAADAGDLLSWFVFVVRLPRGGGAALRDRVLERMGDRGVQCGRYFAPVHEQGAYRGFALRHPLPVTEAESRRTLALPFSSVMTRGQVRYVAEQMREALAAGAA